MTILRVQASMQMFTNLPRDVVTNTWHFETDDVDPPADAAALAATRLQTFYSTALNNMVANYISGSNMRIRAWDLTDPEPRAAIFDQQVAMTWGTKGATYAPTEVACVLSFQGLPISGVNQARRRNRIYLGGLDESAFALSTTTAFPMLSTALIAQVTTAADNLLQDNDTGLQWVGLSNATGLPTTFQLANGWVDNSPDTQRRRGVNATSRTLW